MGWATTKESGMQFDRLTVRGGLRSVLGALLACQVLTGCIWNVKSASPEREQASGLVATVLDWVGTQAVETCGVGELESVRVVFAKGPDGEAYLTKTEFTCLD